MDTMLGKGAGHRLAAMGFVCVWVVLCWPWLSGAATIPFDAKAHFQAQIQFLAQALHSGQSPFWNHNVFAGSPQIADPQSLIFSPAILLALLSPSPSFRLVDAFVLAHLLLGGLALVMLFKDRGWHPAGAFMAATVFAFGGSAAWRVQHVGQIASLGYFALALWLTARTLQKPSLLSGAAAGLAAALMVLEPDQVVLLGGYVLAALVAAHWLQGGRRAVFGTLPALCVAGLVGAAFIALPLVWTWLFAEATTRPAVDLVEAQRGSLHPASLLTAFVADLFGARDTRVDFWGPYARSWGARELFLSENMGQVYFGALPLLLLVAPGLSRGWLWDRGVRVLTLSLVAMGLFALGRYTPAFTLFYDYLPGVKLFRRPADATFIIGVLVAVLSGYVLHRLLAESDPARLRRDLVVMAAVAAGMLALALAVAAGKARFAAGLAPVLAAAFWLAAAMAVVLALSRRRVAAAPMLALLLAGGLTVADLGVNNGPNDDTALPPAMYDVLRPETANETVQVLKRLVAQPAGSARRDRVELLGLGFEWPNAGMVHGFDHTLGYNPLRLAEFSEAVGTRDTIADPSERQFTPLFPSYRSRLADMLGLRYIATPVPVEQVDKALKPGDLQLVARTGQGYIYENPRAMPRVGFAGGWEMADFEGMKRSGRWPDFDPRQIVLLDEEPPQPAVAGGKAVEARIALTRYDNTEVAVDVEAEEGGFVVLNDIWHPWWRASLDGAEVAILKANVLFRAVQVPAGRHRVVFSFHPLDGALAELRERVAPSEPDEALPPLPAEEHPLVAGGQDEPGRSLLSAHDQTIRESLRLSPALPSGGAAAASARRRYPPEF